MSLVSTKQEWRCICGRYVFGYAEDEKFYFFEGRAAPAADNPLHLMARCPLCAHLNGLALDEGIEVKAAPPPEPEPGALELAGANGIDVEGMVGSGKYNTLTIRDIKAAIGILERRAKERLSETVHIPQAHYGLASGRGRPGNVPPR